MGYHFSSRTAAPFIGGCLLTLTAFALVPRPAAAQPTQPALFVAHYIATNPQFDNYASVSSFTINPSGTLNFVSTVYTNDWPQTISISPDGKFLAVGHGTSSSTFEDVLVFEVKPDASLEMYAVTLTPDSPLDVCWVKDRILAVTETRSSGTNRVHTYFLDEVIKRLVLVDSEETGSFNSYLVAHPSGAYLYAQDSPLAGTQQIRAFSVDEDGEMTFVGSAFTTLYPLEMVMSSTGDRLYATAGIGLLSGGDSHRIHGFQVNPADGTLSDIPGTPFFSPGDSPADVAISGDDSVLIVGHGADGDLHTFFISEEDGFLTPTGFFFSVGGQGDIGKVAALDDLVFATREFSNTSQGIPAGLLTFRLEADGSLTQIGDTLNTNGKRPQSLAVWKPAPNSRGDIDADGDVDDVDVSLFVGVLLGNPLDPDHVGRSDLNDDGLADGRDIALFTFYYLNPIVLGPCCKADFTCSVMTEEECDALTGSAWLGGGAVCDQCPLPPPVIDDAFPNTTLFCNNIPGYQVFFSIFGSGFSPLATAKLVAPGSPDILAFFIDAGASDFILAGFELEGAPTGIYDLVVTNPDGQSASAGMAIMIEPCQ